MTATIANHNVDASKKTVIGNNIKLGFQYFHPKNNYIFSKSTFVEFHLRF